MWDQYSIGLAVVLVSAIIAFLALVREKDDLHRLLIIDLVEIPSLAVIALLGTDLAEALILPGLVVGIAELLALSQIYLAKEGLNDRQVKRLEVEVITRSHAPAIIALLLVAYGLVLSGFTGGAIAGLGVIFYVMARGKGERFELGGDRERDYLGGMDPCLLHLHVLPHVLVYGVDACGDRDPAQGNRKVIPYGQHVG